MCDARYSKGIVSALVLFVFTQCFVGDAEETFKDRIWLWCHVEGAHNIGQRHHHNYGFGDYKFTVSPLEAASLLGIDNVFMVKYNIGPNPGPKPMDFPNYYESRHFNSFKKVVWSVVGEGGRSSLKERKNALKLMQLNTNVTGFVMDDFFSKRHRPLTPRQLCELREEVSRTLPHLSDTKLWVVLYNTEVTNANFAARFVPWLKEVDGITLWFKNQASLTPDNMDKVLSTLEQHLSGFTNRPKVMLGCYAWRYLEKMHGNLTSFYMDNQLEFARQTLATNRIQGIVFLASCIADPEGPAGPGINAIKNWISLNKDTAISAGSQPELSKVRE